MRILAIETSCDETAIALIEAKGTDLMLKKPISYKILKEEVASQIASHAPFGGVVPNIAKREHQENLPILYRKMFGGGALEKKAWAKIDYIAVTAGPGLEPALWTGIVFAKELAKKWKKPLIGANHLEGHLYSFLLPKTKKLKKNKGLFPAIALIVSGGHTILLKVDNLKAWKKLGETVDDAAGEAYDKVARLLGLPYPGGPVIQKLADEGNPLAINFPRPMLHHKNYNFSFSGLKTSVLYFVRDNPEVKPADVAASFVAAATEVLVKKTMRAVSEFKAKTILLSGGVAANKHLRDNLLSSASKAKVNFYVAEQKYNTDNAAMIGAAAYINLLRKKKFKLIAKGNLGI